jgi:hypothetical protein
MRSLRLVLTYYVNGLEIWKVPLGGRQETRVLEKKIGSNENFALVEDGLYLTASSGFDSPGKLYFFDFATNRLTTVLTIQRLFLGLAVSPDRRTILYSQSEPISGSLMLVENFR